MKKIFTSVLAMFITLFLFAQSSFTGVDLSRYVRIGRYDLPEPTRTVAPANSLLAQEVSAVTYNWDTQTLFVVGDGGTSVVQVSKTGQLINSMTLAPGSSPQGTEFYDTEGLTYIGNGQFVMSEERDRQAVLFTYLAGGTLIRSNTQTVKLGTFVQNIGTEGISYDPLTNGYICIKEKQPQGIFQTGIDFIAGTATNGSPTTENSTNLFNPSLTNLLDFADVFALSNLPVLSGQPSYGNLLVLSQESGKIINIDRSGNISSSLTIVSDPGNPLDVPSQQHEGLTMDRDGNLYVVSENGGGDFDHPQLWVYAPATVANLAPTAITLSNAINNILENTSTTSPIKVADIVVTDDGQGINNLSVGGTDAAFFQITGTGLYIKAGTVLDYETKTSYSITVNVDDATVGSTPDATINYTLAVTDVLVETPTAATLTISEVAPWSSGSSPVAADWFEVTNNGTSTVNITGWKMDDNSNAFASSVALNGITTIAPGESVIFLETATPATTIPLFLSTWFGANPPAGLQVGSYTGSGVGLSTAGDAVNLFDASGALQAKVMFGASPAGPSFPTFNNAAGLNNTTITQLSATGVNGAFAAVNDANEIGSPGSIGKLIISEVAPWSSGNSPVGADWFEVTNTRATAVDITGWKWDDNSGSPAAAVALNGITTIAPGESVIFLETATPATTIPLFKSTWFGATPPAGIHIGSYSGSGVGLSSGGDAVNLYNSSNVLQANVAFGASPAGPVFPTFDNAAGLNVATISQLSQAGINGAFVANNDANEIGSPGSIVTVTCPVITASATAPAITCAGGTTTVTVAATGGIAPYTITGDSLTVGAGTYNYIITDAKGCTGAASITVAAGTGATLNQPGTFTTKTTFVYQGETGKPYTIPNVAGVTYAWTYSGTGATINGNTNSITIDYSASATSGNLSVTASNACGTSAARTLAIFTNIPITVNTSNYDYSFVTVGCNRVDYLDTAFSSNDIDYSTGASTANVYQLKRLFTEISHLNPLPKYLILTGDIVMGYKTPSTPDTAELVKQLTAWKAIYESHPLSSMGIQLVAISGNHETQDKAAGKKSFLSAEQIFTRVMAPYIRGNNGPGIGGADSLTTDQSKLTYSFNFNGDHFIILNTDPVGKDNQVPYKWLAGDIQAARANNARHIFAFGHKPAYSSPLTPKGGLDADATLPQRDSLWKYLEANNCEAMFSAHEHLWDSIHPHAGKTWQVIAGNGGSRVEPVWVGAGKQYYGYTLVNLYTDKKVNVMGLGRNTGQSTTAGGTPYPVNEDANPTTVRNNFNICLTTTSKSTITANNSYVWNGVTYTASGTYLKALVNTAGCDSIATLILQLIKTNQPPVVTITSPVTGNPYNAGTVIVLHANATDADGIIKNVEFYNNGVKFAEDSTAPYEFTGNEVEPGNYVLTARATDDSGAVTISDTVKITVNGCTGSGNISAEGYSNIPGSQVADLLASPNYPNSPDVTASLNIFEYGNNLGDNYGARVRGYICAPQTGNYTFYVAGDDQAGLWLSADENPANKVLIAYNETHVNPRAWFTYPTQKSATIRLVKGGRYYVETLHKEATGLDYLSVAWKLPNGVFEGPIPGSRLSPFITAIPARNGNFTTAMESRSIVSNAVKGLTVKVLPNPSPTAFTIITSSNSEKTLSINITDVQGRVVERKVNVAANGTVQVGSKLSAGVYFAEVIQGTQKQILKLVKK